MTDTTALPAGYSRAPEVLVRSLEHSVQSADHAWETYEISGDPESVLVHWRTNDDMDHGVPTAYADNTYEVYAANDGSTVNGGPDAIGRALHFAGGGSRHGIGHAVIVRVNGEAVVGRA